MPVETVLKLFYFLIALGIILLLVVVFKDAAFKILGIEAFDKKVAIIATGGSIQLNCIDDTKHSIQTLEDIGIFYEGEKRVAFPVVFWQGKVVSSTQEITLDEESDIKLNLNPSEITFLLGSLSVEPFAEESQILIAFFQEDKFCQDYSKQSDPSREASDFTNRCSKKFLGFLNFDPQNNPILLTCGTPETINGGGG